MQNNELLDEMHETFVRQELEYLRKIIPTIVERMQQQNLKDYMVSGLLTEFIWHAGSFLNESLIQACEHVIDDVRTQKAFPPRMSKNELNLVSNILHAIDEMDVDKSKTTDIEVSYEVYQLSRRYHADMQ
jgi:hypothetical protein